MSLDDDLRAWGESRRMASPSAAEARALVERARRRRGVPLGWVLGGGGLALAAAGALALLLVLRPGSPDTPPRVEERVEPVVAERVAPPSPALSPGRHDVAGGTVEVLPHGQVLLVEDGLELRGGSLAVLSGADVAVRVGDRTVRGERYEVEYAPFVVRVREGHARITGPATVVELGPGEALVDGIVQRVRVERDPVQTAPEGPATPEAPATPGSPDLPEDAVVVAKRELLAGDLDVARSTLVAHLADAPSDAEAWMLLARVESRAGQDAAAAEAWTRVVRHGAPARAHTARYEAAILLEDQPERVVELLTPFVDDPGPLAPEAHLRLGRALVAVGRVEEGRLHLTQVVEGFPGTRAAGRARNELAALPE